MEFKMMQEHYEDGVLMSELDGSYAMNTEYFHGILEIMIFLFMRRNRPAMREKILEMMQEEVQAVKQYNDTDFEIGFSLEHPLSYMGQKAFIEMLNLPCKEINRFLEHIQDKDYSHG